MTEYGYPAGSKTALSGSRTVFPGYTFVAPTFVMYGHPLGQVGLKMFLFGPKQPVGPSIPPADSGYAKAGQLRRRNGRKNSPELT